MSTLRGIARDLVEKRLWPVAVLLGVGIVAALAVALSASGAEPVQDGASGAAGAGPSNGAVTMAEPNELNADRGLLGAPNDPFRRSPRAGAPGSAPTSAQPARGPSATATADPLGGGGNGAGGTVTLAGPLGASSGGGTDATPTGPRTGPVQAPEPAARPERGDDDDREREESFVLWEVDVSMFRGERKVRDIRNVAPLTPLPSAKRPASLFFGVFNGGSSAGFVIHRFVKVEGSTCERRPPGECSLLRLDAGSDARLSFEQDGKKVSYRIVVDAIRKLITGDERRAREHRQRQSRYGACLLKTLGQDYGAVLFDGDQGTWSAGGSLEECLEG